MEIKIWEGGLQAQELNAIEKIKLTFCPPPPKLPNQGKSMQGQLRNISGSREGANKQVISSQADSLIKISRIWADFFPANTSNQPI